MFKFWYNVYTDTLTIDINTEIIINVEIKLYFA